MGRFFYITQLITNGCLIIGLIIGLFLISNHLNNLEMLINQKEQTNRIQRKLDNLEYKINKALDKLYNP